MHTHAHTQTTPLPPQHAHTQNPPHPPTPTSTPTSTHTHLHHLRHGHWLHGSCGRRRWRRGNRQHSGRRHWKAVVGRLGLGGDRPGGHSLARGELAARGRGGDVVVVAGIVVRQRLHFQLSLQRLSQVFHRLLLLLQRLGQEDEKEQCLRSPCKMSTFNMLVAYSELSRVPVRVTVGNSGQCSTMQYYFIHP